MLYSLPYKEYASLPIRKILTLPVGSLAIRQMSVSCPRNSKKDKKWTAGPMGQHTVSLLSICLSLGVLYCGSVWQQGLLSSRLLPHRSPACCWVHCWKQELSCSGIQNPCRVKDGKFLGGASMLRSTVSQGKLRTSLLSLLRLYRLNHCLCTNHAPWALEMVGLSANMEHRILGHLLGIRSGKCIYTLLYGRVTTHCKYGQCLGKLKGPLIKNKHQKEWNYAVFRKIE